MDRKHREESLRRAREILGQTPEERARKRAAAERATAKARQTLARVEVRQMRERERALDEIDAALDQLEDQLSWLMYGRSSRS